ncbi:hypothetical protein NPIL_338511 [Nephila pilipes]|uniref:Uncharacterized protein n=1 Tax=Nephila pilipes TaxID=299642 RepID=A0A8X6ILV9_NEPPI|nr:hypothetical protein NPIL_338511 [Nephila pilipes]
MRGIFDPITVLTPSLQGSCCNGEKSIILNHIPPSLSPPPFIFMRTCFSPSNYLPKFPNFFSQFLQIIFVVFCTTCLDNTRNYPSYPNPEKYSTGLKGFYGYWQGWKGAFLRRGGGRSAATLREERGGKKEGMD